MTVTVGIGYTRCDKMAAHPSYRRIRRPVRAVMEGDMLSVCEVPEAWWTKLQWLSDRVKVRAPEAILSTPAFRPRHNMSAPIRLGRDHIHNRDQNIL